MNIPTARALSPSFLLVLKFTRFIEYTYKKKTRALEYTLDCFKYFMPISSDGWSLGRFSGMTYPVETAEHLANAVCSFDLSENDFYIWACSGTNDVAYNRIWTQVQALAQLSDMFSVSHLTFHEQEEARHEFRSLEEYLYNALPFIFPTNK